MEKKVATMKKKLTEVLNKYECRIPAVKGVKNLSRSDLETAILYGDTIAAYGTWEGMLMKPRGGVAGLLSAFGLPC